MKLKMHAVGEKSLKIIKNNVSQGLKKFRQWSSRPGDLEHEEFNQDYVEKWVCERDIW